MLKIETDGKELETFKGAQKSLEHIQYIALEMPIISDKEKKCFQILEQNNFERIESLEKDRNFFFKKKI